MYISPPISVLAILAVGLAGTAWVAPPQREVAQVTVGLPAATYSKLTLLAKGRIGTDGQPLTVAQIIEELATDRR